jgi:hypothetical protein
MLKWTCDLCGSELPDYCDAYQCPATTEPGDPDVLDAAA